MSNQANTKANKFNYVKWGFITALVGSIAAVLSIPQELKCSMGLGFIANGCPMLQQDVKIITQAETGESLAGVKVQVISTGAPENQLTDSNGYATVKIANKGEVRINLSKSGYPIQDFTINLTNDQNTVRIIRLAKSGQPDVSSVPTPPTPNPNQTPDISPPKPIFKEIPWNETASNLIGNVDQDFTYMCSPNGTVSDNVFGTYIYTSGSSICSAAVHAGIINTKNGGKVQIRIRSGDTFYNATTRNGVASQRYGNYKGSFTFLKEGLPIVTGQIQLIEWNETASALNGKLDQEFTYMCSPNGTVSDNIFGTDIYTTGSSICSSAVHAGVINTKNGGTVKIIIRPEGKFYNPTTSNGVVSSRYDSYPWSFKFIK